MFNVTNFGEHPTNPHYIVFRYKTEKEYLLFKELLSTDKLFFEAEEHQSEDKKTYMIAVKSGNQAVATQHNYYVLGRFRNRTFNNNKWVKLVLVVTVLFLVTAVVGYLKS